jgi:hypothetical protein
LSRSRRPNLDPNRIAVLRSHRSGDFDAMLAIASPRGAGPVRLQVAERTRVPAAGASAWADAALAGTRLLLLPSASTICRTYRLSEMAATQAEQSLRLQAEAHLLGGVPAHRVAMGLLPETEASDRVGVLLAWPQQAETPRPAGRSWRVVPEIAALLAASGGEPPSEPMLLAEPSDGSIAVVLADARGGIAARATCELPSEDEPWRDSVRRALVETAISAGWPAARAAAAAAMAAEATDDAPLLAMPASSAAPFAAAVAPLPPDPAGRLLAAAALAAAGPMEAFTRITPDAEAEEQTPLERALHSSLSRLAKPRAAVAVIAAALLVAAMVPIVAAGLRVAILRWKLPDPLGFESAMRDSERRLAVYRELQTQAWPLAKLLGDLSNCLPESIELQSVVIAHGEPITIRGLAKPEGDRTGAEGIIELERRLRQTGVFDKITKRWEEPDARGVFSFSLSTHVTRPTLQARFEADGDYAVTSFAERRYGPAARPTPSASASAGFPSASASRSASPSPRQERSPSPSAAADAAPAGSRPAVPSASTAASPDTSPAASPPAVVATGGSEAGGGADGGDADGGDAPSSLPERGIGRRRADGGSRAVEVPTAEAEGLPPALSDLEISVMSKAEVRTALERVAKARQLTGLDDETKARLKADFDRLMARLREAP